MDELKIDVFGRVQGVGFRQFVKKTADELRLSGYVRNYRDGRVSIIAQGNKSSLTQFLERIEKGPALSKISGVSYLWRNSLSSHHGFVISVDDGFIQDQTKSFTNLGKNLLNLQRAVPLHVAIIPDGNRRWAKEKGLNAVEGYKRCASKEKIYDFLREIKELGIKYVSLWTFSTENWKRDKKEVKVLLQMANYAAKKFKPEFIKNKIRFKHIGRKDRLPKKLVKNLEILEKQTSHFTDLTLQICFDYGGRDELVRAFNKMLENGVKKVDEKSISQYLDTEGIPDPDLIIRTSGEHRTSGFMPFQSTYAELYFTPLYFPDFNSSELRKAVEEFSNRKRNFGK